LSKILFEAVGDENIYQVGIYYSNRYGAWLPDFPWCNVPRWEKMGQTITKYNR
jgi:hypothetical protein